MNDKEFNILKRKVAKIAKDWASIIGLNSHRLRFQYIRENHAEGNTVATAHPLWQYKHHVIKFYMPTVAECTDDSELEEDILHELVHILAAPMAGNDPPATQAETEKNEYAVQCITYALIWARDTGRKK